MKRMLMTAAVLMAVPAWVTAASTVISTGQEVVLMEHRERERPTVFVFIRPASSLERAFAEDLERSAGDTAAVRLVHLQGSDDPVARQYEVTETPAALVYDRRGRLVGRGVDAETVRQAVQKASGVMRIDWAEPGDPRFAEAERVLGRPLNSGILRTMSLKPEYLAYINDLSQKAHFSDGYLDRRTKEMIATYVSALNRCRY